MGVDEELFMRRISSLVGLIGIALTAAAIPASAGVIPIVNPSFELPVLGPGDHGGVYNQGPITGWAQFEGPNSGVFNPSLYPLAGYSAPNGQQVGYTGNGTSEGDRALIGQELGAISPGTTYTLSALVGERLDYPIGNYRMEMGWLVGGISGVFTPFAISNNPGSPVPGTFVLVSLTGTAPLSATGDLAIAFSGGLGNTPGQANWDSVTLTSTVPEPAIWAMMLLGFAGIGFIAYRRTKKAVLAAA
jgi:PEP-CTERM motif